MSHERCTLPTWCRMRQDWLRPTRHRGVRQPPTVVSFALVLHSLLLSTSSLQDEQDKQNQYQERDATSGAAYNGGQVVLFLAKMDSQKTNSRTRNCRN
jgi:hypothetical protein